MKSKRSDSASQPGVRWWPALVILVASGLFLLRIWTRESLNRQEEVVSTVVASLATAAALLVWLLLLSRLPWKRRLLTLSVVALVALAASQSLVFRGFSGDLVPTFRWRWADDDQAAALEVP